jgi:Glycosyltransferase family 87
MPLKRDGRSTFLYLAGSVCLIMAGLFFTYGYEKTWHLWNIPTFMPYLADARLITAAAESHALGYDPLIRNPRDPWGRPMNYPRVWQLLFYLRLCQADTIYFGVIFAAVFFSGVFLITKNIDRSTAWLMTCAVFSPAVLLGLERGNNDLLVFFLLSLAVYVVKKSRVGTTVVIGLSFVLKLYPIFGLAIFLRERKRVFLAIMMSSIIVCGIYTMIVFDELRLIRLATPTTTALGLSYGLDVAWMRAGTSRPDATIVLRIVSYAAVLLTAAFSLFHAGRRVDSMDDQNGHMDSFRVGASAYIGTFLIGGNWDYRLMILLLVIPQLMSWRRSPWNGARYIAITTMLCLLMALWAPFTGRMLAHFSAGPVVNGLLDLLCKWIVFSGLLYLFIFSWPDWLKSSPPHVKTLPQSR